MNQAKSLNLNPIKSRSFKGELPSGAKKTNTIPFNQIDKKQFMTVLNLGVTSPKAQMPAE
jgi:hypothetical protein